MSHMAITNLAGKILIASQVDTGHRTVMGCVECVCTLFIGNPEMNTPLLQSRRRWEDNMKLNLTEAECEDTGWVYPD